MKKILIVLLSFMMLTLAFGCKKEEEKLIAYSKGGITVQLPEGLTEDDYAGYAAAYSNDDFAIEAYVEPFSVLRAFDYDLDTFTLEEYGKEWLKINDMNTQFVKDSNNNLYVTYTEDIDGVSNFFYVTIREGSEGYWNISFSTLAENAETYTKLFEKYSDTIVVE
ncbi:MAG: hypothetical protein Q4C64_02105 [Erysipelotrichia bacterium]|nr:hypothetical protein [Erysipelotrichia bacterium]